MKHLFNLAKLALILILFNFQSASASHMMGGDISYIWLGGKKYELTFKIYRDCRGIPFNSPSIKISDKNNANSMSVSYTRTAINDLTMLCADTSVKSPCLPVNTPAGDGVEEHIFKATIDFAASPYSYYDNNNICEVYIQLEQCCRNGAITTINPGNFYIEAMMNLCNSKYANSSPQFLDVGSLRANCNQAFKTNFGAIDFIDFDSISYELYQPMNGFKTFETYTGNFTSALPMTPYCPPNPGVLTCRPLPNSKPPRGVYFNNTTGEFVITPTKCDETAVISIKITEWRNFNGKWLTMGYVIRDIQIIVRQSPDNIPPELDLEDKYQFTTRKKTCFDFPSTDKLYLPNQKDSAGMTTDIKILNPPLGSTFEYVDSSVRLKTGKFCWQVPDSAYLQLQNLSKSIPLVFEVRDGNCNVPGWSRKTTSLQLLAPDSSGYLSMNAYYDANKSLSKDSVEKGLHSRLLVRENNQTFAIETDKNGLFADSFGIGQYKIGPAPHPYLNSLKADTSLLIEMDSAYQLDFPLYKKNGIYGRIYTDYNKNCMYDSGDYPLSGYLVYTDSNKYAGLSDRNGFYFIPIKDTGIYTLYCNYKPNAYQVNCPVSKTITVNYIQDSVYEDNDFGVSENPDFFDIKTTLKTSRFLRRNQTATVSYLYENKGNLLATNFDVYIPVPKNLVYSIGSKTYGVGGDTIKIHIDSLSPKQTVTITYNTFINSNYFKVNDLICFTIFTDQNTLIRDSVKSNNYYNMCVVVNAPYDPNEKTAITNHAITTLDNYIDYTVYFQNTGTDTAFRVMVTDTLDTKYLDLNGFEINWSDAPCDVSLSGNVLYFIFDPIDLPHLSVAGDQSISGFSFRLGLKSKIKTEAAFTNRVSIFFDLEDAVITKPCETEILSPTHISKFVNKTFCKDGINTLHIKSNIELKKDNFYIVEMSDALDDFKNPIQIDSIQSSAEIDSIKFNFNPSINGEKLLRIRTTSPPSVGILNKGLITVDANTKKHFLINSNINNYTLCENDTLKMEIVGNTYDYKINRNGIDQSTFNQVKSYKFKLKSNDLFTIYAKDPVNQCIDSSVIDLQILKAPIITMQITELKQSYCSNEIIDIEVSGGINYSIHDGNKTISALGTTSKINYQLSSNSALWAYGVDAKSCFNHSDTANLSVYPIPAKPIIKTSQDTLSIALYPNVKWYYNNTLTKETRNFFPNALSGSYFVEVAADNCNNKSDVYQHFNTEIRQNENVSNSIRIYPNPSNGLLTIENLSDQTYTINIYSSTGVLIMVYTCGDKDTTVDMTDLAGGFYIIEAINENGLITHHSFQLIR